MRYLTKSRFKLALECITKLYYTKKPAEWSDKNDDDTFLRALAEGGHQVGELAKFYFCDDPAGDQITVDTLKTDEALERTEKMLKKPGRVVIAEAAFKYNNLLIRADIVVKEGNTISIYEVKAKSYDEVDTEFLNKNNSAVASKWVPYLYDIAFQKYVVAHSDTGKKYKVRAFLMLVDKNKTTNIEGMNQLFKIVRTGDRTKVEVKSGLTKKDIGSTVLTPVDVETICNRIIDEWTVPSDYKPNMTFVDFVNEAADIYEKDKLVYTVIGKKCKDCQFYTDEKDDPKLKSGFINCWKHHTGLSERELKKPLVTELWNGHAGNVSYAERLIRMNKYFMDEIEEADIAPQKAKPREKAGLTPLERRMEQINRIKTKDRTSYFDKDGMKREMESWEGHFPLHMIDFETSAVALPFHKGAGPYEGIAFQFSHHTIDENWNIEHKTQYLSFEPNFYPNFEFVRELKKALSGNNGKVFRYHNHENSYLGMIYYQLLNYPDPPADRQELMEFIQSITHSGNDSAHTWSGPRDMIDLYDLVLRYYYPPAAKGSNSLKFILPSLINESEYLKSKYGKPGIYGKGLAVKSLNFDDHVWIKPAVNNNPYKTLPRVFEEYTPEQLDDLVKNMEHLADGGAALTAYNYLQFSHLPDKQRESIRDSLLRYCELDTMAMVMILEGWKDMCR